MRRIGQSSSNCSGARKAAIPKRLATHALESVPLGRIALAPTAWGKASCRPKGEYDLILKLINDDDSILDAEILEV